MKTVDDRIRTLADIHLMIYYQLQLPNRRKIFAIYALCLLMYAVANPDPNPRGGGQLPNPKSAILCSKRVDWWGAANTYTIYTRAGGQLPNPKSAILR